ncbi:MAG TPA: membrane protein insertase YidC [Sporichthyaceae bacterium]
MKIFEPLYDGVSWIILMFHDGFDNVGMNESWSWCLAIVGLVVMIRIALIPLFVKQIRSMRNMQVLQPKIKAIQERYKGDREKTSQELMKLYKEHNTNPLSSCLPVLAQSPFFLALFRVLSHISKGKTVGVLSQSDVDSARHATFLGANLADKFIGADTTHVQIVTLLMIVAMSASQFYTQRQLMTKNMPAPVPGQPVGQFMQQQKMMMYLFPIMFGVFGINFPVGVLLYWLVSNFWSMGQQLYVIRRMPAIGSPAYDAMMKRKGKKSGGEGEAGDEGDAGGMFAKRPGGPKPSPNGNGASPPASGPPVRTQPKNQPRSQRSSPPKKR